MTGREPWNAGCPPILWTPTDGQYITTGLLFKPFRWWEKALNLGAGLSIVAALAWLMRSC